MHDHGTRNDHDGHEHSGHRGHGHSHAPASFGRAFAIGVALNIGYMIAEFAFGQRAHSLALVADAGHNLSDVLGLLLAWGASILATRQPTARRTYGYRRSSILAALTNAVVLLVVIGGIAWEALRRLLHPEPVAGGIVLIVAAGGILVNGAAAALFAAGRKGDLNIRGAFQHMVSDALVSLGVVVAGVLILLTGWVWLDPVVSIVVSAVIVWGTWGLLRESLDLALDAVPEGINIEAVRQYLAEAPGVTDVHDLHIWAMSTTEPALTAHLVLPTVTDHDAFLRELTDRLHERFGIEHATVQIETGDSAHLCHCSLVSATPGYRLIPD